nr:putative ribonuclease H-like domain-containing protein [Tanacetum cinerariifolium]
TQFCDDKGIKREYSLARTPQQNGLAKRRNRTLIEAERTMALVTKPHNKTPYELICGRPPLIDFLKPFRCPVTILNTRDNLGKFEDKADEGYFVGYSVVSKVIRVFNKRRTKEQLGAGEDEKKKELERKYILIPICTTVPLISQDAKDSVEDAGKKAPEVDASEASDNGHTQKEGIDYDEVFAPVARIEAIRLFLAYASFKDFVVYQMDVKSAFLYAKIKEEVYVCQPPSFEDPNFPYKVYKGEKGFYRLHQAPRAWYETLSTYLLDNGFHKGQIDKTLFIKRHKDDILLVQVYVDDIIFGSPKKELSNEFEKLMHDKFQISSMGKLSFFLGLQVKQKSDGIFISQDKYVAGILKKFDFVTVKIASTPMKSNKPLIKDEEAKDVDVHLYRSMIGSLMYLTTSRPDITFTVCDCARFQVTPKTSHLHDVKRIFRYLKGQPKLGLWYPKDLPFDLEAYSDSDYARASLDKKSTIEGYQFLGKRLISWQCKKHTIVANSTIETEYVAAANCCGQVLWIQNQLLNYGFNLMNTKIYIDNVKPA